MPDTPTAESGAPQAPPATPEPTPTPDPQPAKPVTSEDLATLRKNRDGDGLRKAIDSITRGGQPPAGQPPAQKPQPAPGAEAPSDGLGGEPKQFHIQFDGADVALDDSDSYLGYGNFGKLKKAAAHQKKTLEGYTRRLRGAEENTGVLQAQVNALTTERDELKQRTDHPAPAAPAAPTAPGAPAPAAPSPAASEESFELPRCPEEPQYSSEDPLDWNDDDRKKSREHNKLMRAYEAARDEVIAKLVARVQQPLQPGQYNNDPTLVQKVDELSAFVQQEQGSQAEEVAGRMKENFWKDVTSFQDLHKDELATSRPMGEIHEGVQEWMDNLAWANGIQRPSAGATEEQLVAYAQRKGALVGRYLAGDQEVLDKATSTPPPEGYLQYFRVGKYQKLRKKLIDAKKLGEASTLQDAWQHNYVSHELDNDLQALEAQSHAEGSRAVLDNLQTHQRDDATHIPNNQAAGQAPNGSQPDDQAMSREEKLRILKLPIEEIRRDPELMRKRSLIVQSLKAS